MYKVGDIVLLRKDQSNSGLDNRCQPKVAGKYAKILSVKDGGEEFDMQIEGFAFIWNSVGIGSINKNVSKMFQYEIIDEPFDVLDCLGGAISGEYNDDIKIINENGKTVDEGVYNRAYQNVCQP